MNLKGLTKKTLHNEGIQNLVLRGITVASKFLLSILIIKKLGIYEMGVFGIFQTTITLLIYVLGLDFYTYNTREILKKNSKDLSYFLGNQLIFHGIVYLIVLPLVLLVFLLNVIDFEYILIFYAILICEHLSQEIYRVLIVLKKSVLGSLTLFLRAGVWILALWVFWEFNWIESTITSIFALWLFGTIGAIILGIYHIPFQLRFGPDISWIKKGVKIATPFFIATIFYKIIEFAGRYFLDYYWAKEVVGVYTFFSGVSNIMFVLVHSTVIIVMSPYLIESANEGIEIFKSVFKRYKRQVLYTTVVGFILTSVLIYPLLWYLDNDQLSRNLHVFFTLLFAAAFFCFSYVPHYGLYAFHKDRSLLWASIFGAIINIVANFALVPTYGAFGAALAQIVSMIGLFISKGLLYKRLQNG